MGDFAYNQTMFFTSSAAVDGVPTAWGIYKAVVHGNDNKTEQLDELKVLVKSLGTKIDDMKSEIGALKSDLQFMKSQLEFLKRGLLTVRIRQEKSIMPSSSKALEVARIIAKRVVPNELQELEKPKPKIVIPIPNDPFSGAPEL